jgi:hypothetical protein
VQIPAYSTDIFGHSGVHDKHISATRNERRVPVGRDRSTRNRHPHRCSCRCLACVWTIFGKQGNACEKANGSKKTAGAFAHNLSEH